MQGRVVLGEDLLDMPLLHIRRYFVALNCPV